MDLRKLEIFARVAELGSFSRAAESLHMAQPAVSIAVRNLENEFDCKLFKRTGRQILLTDEGAEALQRAQALLEQAEELRLSMQERKALTRGEIRVACPAMLGTYYLPGLLSQFLDQFPGLTADVLQAGSYDIATMLLDGEAEIGVTNTQISDPQIATKELLEEEVMFCIHKGHALAKRRYVDINAIADFPLILYQSGYMIRELVDEVFFENNSQPNIKLESNFLPLIVQSVIQGLGGTFGLRMMAEQEKDLVGISFRPRITIQMVIAWHANQKMSLANSAFVDWLTQ